MEYVLFVFIMVGEHVNLKTTDFSAKKSCEVAATWINNQSARSAWRDAYKPKAACFKI